MCASQVGNHTTATRARANQTDVRPATRSGTLAPMRRPRLQSTLARAVVPVAAGLGFFVLLGLLLWGIAAVIARNGDDTSSNLAPTIQEMGSAASLASVIATDGPIVLNDLIGSDRHVVLSHTGTSASEGWAIHLAHPADRDATCTVTVVKTTSTFTDCEGRTIGVDDLALPPAGVFPIVNSDGSLSLDLIPD